MELEAIALNLYRQMPNAPKPMQDGFLVPMDNDEYRFCEAIAGEILKARDQAFDAARDERVDAVGA